MKDHDPTDPGPGDAPEREGRLIAVTGIDGSGKSTLSEALVTQLRDRGVRCEMSNWQLDRVERTFIGDLVERLAEEGPTLDPTTVTLLFAANLHHRTRERIRPLLEDGVTVVVDDFGFKVRAQAVAYGLDDAWVDAVYAPVRRPDATVLLDVSPERALDRLERDPTPFETGFRTDDLQRGFLQHQRRVREALESTLQGTSPHVVDPGDAPAEELAHAVARTTGLVRESGAPGAPTGP